MAKIGVEKRIDNEMPDEKCDENQSNNEIPTGPRDRSRNRSVTKCQPIYAPLNRATGKGVGDLSKY